MNLLRRLLRSPRGGIIPPYALQGDSTLVALSPGRLISDPDEAEALGMTADARRLREARDRNT